MGIKRFLKERVSDMIFYFDKSRQNDLDKNQCRILMYHSIEKSNRTVDRMGLAVHPDAFYAHIKYLHDNGFKVLGLSELACMIINQTNMPRESVVITFDDGYKSILTSAAPILRKFGFTATLFINIDFMENRIPRNLYWHDWPVLNWQEVRQLIDAGISIGSHGLTHRRLAGLSDAEIKNEIEESRGIIEKNAQIEINTFSYPNGSFDNRVKSILKDNGFLCSCSSIEGVNTIISDIFALNRTEITGFDDTLIQFKKKIAGSRDWLGYIPSHG